MADISITAGNVLTSTGAVTTQGIAGEAVTAGQCVYKKAADGEYYKADCDASSVSGNSEIDNVAGIALNTAGASQPLHVQTGGTITIGGTVTVGTPYFVSSGTAGGIMPYADLCTTDYVSLIGIATTTGAIKMSISVTGVQVPA